VEHLGTPVLSFGSRKIYIGYCTITSITERGNRCSTLFHSIGLSRAPSDPQNGTAPSHAIIRSAHAIKLKWKIGVPDVPLSVPGHSAHDRGFIIMEKKNTHPHNRQQVSHKRRPRLDHDRREGRAKHEPGPKRNSLIPSMLVLKSHPLRWHLANDLACFWVNSPAWIFKPQILFLRNLTSDIVSETRCL
jgi:hypothetical protein